MKHFRSFGFTIFTALMTSLAANGIAVAAQQTPCPPVGDTLSLLQPQDPGYGEAQEFGRFLQDHHIGLRCITRTTIGSNFLGEARSAAFQTEIGSFSVVFFAEPDGAERITTVLTVSHGRYHYVFRTKQSGLSDHQSMDLDAPLHFLIRGAWFIFVDSRTEQALRLAFLGNRY